MMVVGRALISCIGEPAHDERLGSPAERDVAAEGGGHDLHEPRR